MTSAFNMRPLSPGKRIHVIAPSSPFDADDFERGIARLRQRYDVRHAPDILRRAGYLAGTDEQRIAELLLALQDEKVDAIIAARGGYGATRLLEHLPVSLVTLHPKLLVGFSDITALHALWARAGQGSLHGPMVATLGRSPEPLVERFISAIEGAIPSPIGGLVPIAKGRARGRLLGGNLAVLTALVGTPYAPPLADSVLFLEDIGERPYRVDRMLTTWQQAGWLRLPRAIVLGAFTDAASGPDGVSVEQVLQERLGTLGIPVLGGVRAGHLDDNLELPFGAIVEVDAARGTIVFDDTSVSRDRS